MPRLELADTSHYQEDNKPEINFPVLAQHLWGWMGKASQGDMYVDPDFHSNRAEAHAANIEYIGMYHFLSSAINIRAQAVHFLDVIGRLQEHEFWAIDAERDESTGVEVTEAQVFEFKTYIEAVYPSRGGTYTGRYVDRGNIWTSQRVFTPDHGRFFAAYTTENRAKALALPYSWDMWQYSSAGPVPGVTGKCDMNQIDMDEKFKLICFTQIEPEPNPPVGVSKMELIFTNAEIFNWPDGTKTPAGVAKWLKMPDGSKRHLANYEYEDIKANLPFKEISKISGEILQYPDYTPVGLSSGRMTGTITFP